MSTRSISPAAAAAQYSYPSAAVPSYFPVPFHLQNVQLPAWPAAAAAAAPAYNAVYPMPQAPHRRLLGTSGLVKQGYGFVSFANASDLAAALKEMNGKYVGNRPIKLRKITWKNRSRSLVPMTQPQKKVKAHKRSVIHK